MREPALQSLRPIVRRETSSSVGELEVSIHDVDRRMSDWDSFVEASPQGDLVQTSLWGLSKHFLGQRPALVVLRSADRILAGMLIIQRRVCHGIHVGYIARGPLFGGKDRALLDCSLQAAKSYMQKRGLLGLLVQLAEGDEGFSDALLDAGFFVGGPSVVPEATMRIGVTQPDELILKAMSPMRRRNILKAMKQEFKIEHSSDVVTFHRLHTSTSLRQGFGALSLEYLAAQWRALSDTQNVTILLASYRGNAVAALWLSMYSGVVTFRLAGWDREIKAPSHVNEALHWQAIQWARSANARYYDLGGFDRECAERIVQGLSATSDLQPHNIFKIGFGGNPVLFSRAHCRLTNQSLNWLAGRLDAQLWHSRAMRRLAHQLRN
jgi:lipid II:glycine glycyltransferase (peptidoglycan interpeptide bridge formation enzyme)